MHSVLAECSFKVFFRRAKYGLENIDQNDPAIIIIYIKIKLNYKLNVAVGLKKFLVLNMIYF